MKRVSLENSLSILVFFIIVILALFLVFRGLINSSPDNLPEASLSNSVYKLIEVKNDFQFACGAKLCTLPDGWKINTIIANSLPNKAACTFEPCTIFSVTNGKYEFFFSNQDLKDSSKSPNAFISKTYYLNPETSLTALYYKQFLEKDGKLEEIESQKIKEVYGCPDTYLCVTTGVIEPNTESDFFTEFNTLLTGIVIN